MSEGHFGHQSRQMISSTRKFYIEYIANWSKDQANSNRIVYNIITASLSEGYFCLLSRKTYWDQQPKAVKDLKTILLEEYEVDIQQCDRDLKELLTELIKVGLIDVKNETSA